MSLTPVATTVMVVKAESSASAHTALVAQTPTAVRTAAAPQARVKLNFKFMLLVGADVHDDKIHHTGTVRISFGSGCSSRLLRRSDSAECRANRARTLLTTIRGNP
jgi:hypothetical protein